MGEPAWVLGRFAHQTQGGSESRPLEFGQFERRSLVGGSGRLGTGASGWACSLRSVYIISIDIPTYVGSYSAYGRQYPG